MKLSSGQKGYAYIWVAISGLVLIGFVGLASDFAYAYLVGAKLQAVADAGALAGAQKVKVDTFAQVGAAAHNTAAQNVVTGNSVQLALNPSNSISGDIVIGHFQIATNTFTPTLVGADAVQTRAHRPDSGSPAVALLFAPMFGTSTSSVSRTSIAMNVGGIGAGIIVLDPSSPNALHMNGNPTIQVPNGAIVVDSNSSKAVSVNGNPSITAPDLNVVGGGSVSSGVLSGNLNVKAPYVSDPLASLVPPTPGTSLPTPNGKNITLNPGYYPGGVSANNGSVTLNPGVYIFSGQGFQLGGSSSLTANGVLIYVSGVGGGNPSVSLGGGGACVITAMTTGPYAGVAIWQDASLKGGVNLVGSPQMSITGTLYFPGASTSISGNSSALASQLITKTLSASGNGSLSINYDGRFATAGKVFLTR